jgi:hypothetical protein
MVQLVLGVYAAVCAASTIAFVALSLASKGIESDGLVEEPVTGDRRSDFDPQAAG